jgi:hypothetical protein
VEQWVVEQSAKEGPPTEWVTLPIDDAGAIAVSPTGKPPEDGERVVDGHVIHYANRASHFVTFPGPNRWAHYRPVRAGGVLDWLRTIAQRLSRSYGWKEAEAAGFVLSDVHPPVSQVRWEIPYSRPWEKARWAVNLQVAYWVTPQSVARTYRGLRNELLNGDPKPRSLSDSRAVLGVFAFQHRSGHTWKDAMALWNRRNLGVPYQDVRVFIRDAREAFERITGEALEWKGRAVEPLSEER